MTTRECYVSAAFSSLTVSVKTEEQMKQEKMDQIVQLIQISHVSVFSCTPIEGKNVVCHVTVFGPMMRKNNR